MAVDIFCGEPPTHIKQWILSHRQPIIPEGPIFDKIVAYLETGKYSDSKPLTVDDISLSVGTDNLKVNYHADLSATDNGYMEPCIVLGYNASIPEYIKYKSGDNRIYLRSWDGEEEHDFSAITTGTRNVYTKSYDETTYETIYTPTEKIVTVPDGTGMFTYGNNNSYQVPKNVVVDGINYKFAGYNITFQTRHLLQTAGSYDYRFSYDDTGRWSNSPIRTWMNSFGAEMIPGVVVKADNSDFLDSVSLVHKFKDEECFLKNVQKVLNKTWRYKNGPADVTSDFFWFLGTGNINSSGYDTDGEQKFMDHIYDTTIFTGIWPDVIAVGRAHPNLKRYKMILESDGSVSDGDADNRWWLRSVDLTSASNYQLRAHISTFDYQLDSDSPESYISYVDSGFNSHACGVVPAFTIG